MFVASLVMLSRNANTRKRHTLDWNHLTDCLDKVLRNGLVGKPEFGSSNWYTNTQNSHLCCERRALQTMYGLTVALLPPEHDPHLG